MSVILPRKKSLFPESDVIALARLPFQRRVFTLPPLPLMLLRSLTSSFYLSVHCRANGRTNCKHNLALFPFAFAPSQPNDIQPEPSLLPPTRRGLLLPLHALSAEALCSSHLSSSPLRYGHSLASRPLRPQAGLILGIVACSTM